MATRATVKKPVKVVRKLNRRPDKVSMITRVRDRVIWPGKYSGGD